MVISFCVDCCVLSCLYHTCTYCFQVSVVAEFGTMKSIDVVVIKVVLVIYLSSISMLDFDNDHIF